MDVVAINTGLDQVSAALTAALNTIATLKAAVNAPPVPPVVVPPPVVPPPPPVVPPVVPPPLDPSVTVTANWITTPHDRIPNFPVGNGIVVKAGEIRIWNQIDDTKYDTIRIEAGGVLSFANNPTRMRVTNLLLLPGGTLEVVTQAKCEIIFNDVPLDLTNDPEQYGHGLIVVGGKVTIAGQPKTAGVRLNREPKIGDSTLSLWEAVKGWQIGDAVVLPDTRQFFTGITGNQLERPTVASVSADGFTLTLSAPLAYAHAGARDIVGVVTFMPHVSNQTRNVVVKSENASGTRGHIFLTGRADVSLKNYQFTGLGRTRNDVLDPTTFDAAGKLTKLGTNQPGRHPVYCRYLQGPAIPQANGAQFTLEGGSIFCPLDPMPFRWGIAIHGSHFGRIASNVLFNWAGAGIVTVDGSETGNVIDGNFISRTTGISNDGDQRINNAISDFAFEGAGIWCHSPNNYVRNNVVANCTQYGYHYYSVVKGNPAQTFMNLPVSQGSSATVSTLLAAIPIKEFANNEVYGVKEGLMLWSIGAPTGPDIITTISRSVIQGYKSWGTYQGIRCYPLNNFLISGWVHRGDWAVAQSSGSFGFGCSDYTVANMTFDHCDIQGVAHAINPPTAQSTAITGQVPQTMTIQNSTICAIYGITCFSLSKGSSDSFNIAPRRIEINNVKFLDDPTTVAGKYKIGMIYRPGSANIIQLDQVFVTNYNQVQGDNFQVYYKEQVASFVMPITGAVVDSGGPIKHGATTPNLTNQQNWDQSKIAIAGAVAPANATTRTGIAGLVA